MQTECITSCSAPKKKVNAAKKHNVQQDRSIQTKKEHVTARGGGEGSPAFFFWGPGTLGLCVAPKEEFCFV